MSTFAVIKTGGKQYLVAKGQKLKIEKLGIEAGLPAEALAQAGKPVEFKDVLLIMGDKKTEVGTPLVEGAIVKAKVAGQGRARKQIVFRYHAKTRYRKKKGHRQPFTEVEIIEIKKAI
ncbi:MAG: 50S ribosomal protein L21 [bacterium]|nr:50S ribosomal protein L21 [bacterium]